MITKDPTKMTTEELRQHVAELKELARKSFAVPPDHGLQAHDLVPKGFHRRVKDWEHARDLLRGREGL